MKKEITPEMYNYNKFPGPKFEKIVDHIQSVDIDLLLVANYKEAFDLTAFEQRFTTFMLKFDYIVGDWGNEQLRLKGFYKDERASHKELKISHLEDYLLEFCNYGCAYFVLENPNPIEPLKEDEQDPRGERRRRRRSKSSHQNRQQPREQEVKSETASESKTRQRRRKPKQDKRHFEIKSEKDKRDKKQVKKEIQTAKREFVIRQK